MFTTRQPASPAATANSPVGGDDIVALRRFAGLTQESFTKALDISVHTVHNWEQYRRHPDGSTLALIRIAARHPQVLSKNLPTTA